MRHTKIIHCLLALCGIFCSIAPLKAEDCFDTAGRDARIDPDLLRAIAWQESRLNFKAIGPNPVTGYGIGLMQIDSQHLPWMASSYGIHQNQLTSDICTNIYTGTYILALAFNKWGMTWEAVGAYNAGFAMTERQKQRRKNYASKIYTYYWFLKKQAYSRTAEKSLSLPPPALTSQDLLYIVVNKILPRSVNIIQMPVTSINHQIPVY